MFGDGKDPDRREISDLSAARRGPIIVRHGRDVEAFDSLESDDFDDQQRLQLAIIWGAILKHRWLIAGVVLAALLLGVGATLLMQKQYSASAVIQIDREAAQVIEVDGLTPREASAGPEFIDTQVGLLKSETLAKRVVQSLGLRRNNEFRALAGLDPLEPGISASDSANVEDALAARLGAGLRVRQQGLSRLVTIEYTSPSPTLSASIANAMAENFQVLAMERRFESSAYARKFLEEQLSKTKARLEASEREVVAYRHGRIARAGDHRFDHLAHTRVFEAFAQRIDMRRPRQNQPVFRFVHMRGHDRHSLRRHAQHAFLA
jgi:capsular polysaccharide biosynthesis protein